MRSMDIPAYQLRRKPVGGSTFRPGFESVTYTWERLVVSTEQDVGNCFRRLCNASKASHKLLLKNVSGVVKPGEFLAIMGASGAGKTTLLNRLTFRNTGNLKVTGRRCINGIPVDTDSLASISPYVLQDDLFVNTLTALLRMDLGLTKCGNTLIGDPAKGAIGISGGERKRLSFASEVLTVKPSFNESSSDVLRRATSGLDSYMAQNIVQIMKKLAAGGKTVICTIHQPSSEVFNLFVRILLIVEGRTAFLGPIDRALNFFTSQGLPCPANYNPSDFYIFSLAVVPGRELDCRKKIEEICNAYELSDDGSSIAQLLRINHNAFGEENNIVLPQQDRSPYKATWWTQFRVVLWRSWISIVKDPRVAVVKAVSAVCTALFVALIYQGQESPTNSKDIADYIQNIQGVLFLFVINATFESIFGVINVIFTQKELQRCSSSVEHFLVFAGEVPIFLREHFNGMYRTEIYFLGKMIAELPIYVVFPFVSFAIPYFAIELNPAVDRFFMGAGVIILVTNVATSFGYFVSCLTSSVEVATALGAPMILPSLLFGGFFLNNGQVPVYLDWLRYLSWFMYSNEALTINQWQGVRFNTTECSANKTIPLLTCTGEDVLKQFSFKAELFSLDIGCLLALIVAFRLLAYWALPARTYRKT
nr:ABCG2-like5-1 protein [Diaphanosoma celebensis]